MFARLFARACVCVGGNGFSCVKGWPWARNAANSELPQICFHFQQVANFARDIRAKTHTRARSVIPVPFPPPSSILCRSHLPGILNRRLYPKFITRSVTSARGGDLEQKRRSSKSSFSPLATSGDSLRRRREVGTLLEWYKGEEEVRFTTSSLAIMKD